MEDASFFPTVTVHSCGETLRNCLELKKKEVRWANNIGTNCQVIVLAVLLLDSCLAGWWTVSSKLFGHPLVTGHQWEILKLSSPRGLGCLSPLLALSRLLWTILRCTTTEASLCFPCYSRGGAFLCVIWVQTCSQDWWSTLQIQGLVE
jgi:hypothetical protein